MHPTGGIRRQFDGVVLQLDQVLERVGIAELAGMDQAHEQVAHLLRCPCLNWAQRMKNGQLRAGKCAGGLLVILPLFVPGHLNRF